MTKLPKKIQLNGSDCFHLILEHNRRKFGIGNNVIRMVVTLEDPAYLETLEERINQSELIHWIANVRIVRLLLSVPYFSYKDRGKSILLNRLPGRYDAIPEEVLNDVPDLRKDAMLRIDSYQDDKGDTHVIFSFHHVMFDGRGCGLLLQHLTSDQEDTVLFPNRIRRKGLFRQVINMFQVKRVVEQSSRKPIAYLEEKPMKHQVFSLRTIEFSREETAAIDQNAREKGSRFGTNLFQIACVAHALQPMLASSDPIWVPVPYDGRKRGSKGPIISNNMSFLFYRVEINPETELADTVGSLQKQMNEQLKINLPAKYDDLLQFMRYIPKRFNYWMMTRSSKGKMSSFLYSSSGESYYDVAKFSTAFRDTLILPPYSYPPGLIVNFLRDNDQMKLNLGGFSGIFDSNDLSLLEQRLKQLLLTR